MTWDKNDWYAVALIIALLGVGFVLGLYGLGFLDEIWGVDINWHPSGVD